MDKTSIKTEIIRFLESQGPKSKSKIEDYIRLELGTNGDTTSRRMRELVVSRVLTKVQKEHNGKKYWEYSVVELPKVITYDCFKCGFECKDDYVAFERHILDCQLKPIQQTEKLPL